MSNLAPIVIFTYRRDINELIESLNRNSLTKESDLYIFSDGYKNENDKKDVLNVRESLKYIEGFKSVKLEFSTKNKGLASSVIDGVSSILQKYTNIIVLEDDLIVSDNFLEYMNEALNYYQENETIWSISGYTPQLDCLKNYDKDVYLSVRASSWGWATWKDRWESIDWNIKNWEDFKENKKLKKEFNLGGNDMYHMLEMQILGKIDSWAIRWCYNQFLQKSYTIYPVESKLKNIGFDEVGTHNSHGASRWKNAISNTRLVFEEIKLNDEIVQCFKKKYDLKLKTRIGYLLKKYGGYKTVKKIMKLGQKQ